MQSEIRIETYNPSLRTVFKEMNEAWIRKYFRMEEVDTHSLSNPEAYIIDKGGHILFAMVDNEVAGVCALIKMDGNPYDYELAKMAVSPEFQGRGIGKTIGLAVIEKAKSIGARNVYLESNTKLTTAINLYRKIGFEEVEGIPSPYARCNICMALNFG
jgi:ribosomal protein S18 acetylase RimI-like enzyme